MFLKFNPEIHHRKSIRLKGYDYSQPGYYFVTICLKNRLNYFGNIENDKMKLSFAGFAVRRIWYNLPKHFSNISLDAFIIMPNHFHGIVIIKRQLSCGDLINQIPTPDIQLKHFIPYNPMILPIITLGYIIRWFKAKSSLIIRRTAKEDYFSWQTLYYDRIIRNESELNRIREYIKNNPRNWQNDRNNIKSTV